MTACFSRTWRSSSKEAAFSSCSRAPPSGVNRPAAFGISHQVISSRGGERTRVRNSLCRHFCSIVGLLQQSKMSLTAPPSPPPAPSLVSSISVNTPAELHASKGDTVTLSCTFTSTSTPTSKMRVDWSYRPQSGGTPGSVSRRFLRATVQYIY